MVSLSHIACQMEVTIRFTILMVTTIAFFFERLILSSSRMVVAGHANVKFSYTIALGILHNVSLIDLMQ